MAGYFNYFPSASYANNIVTNIIAKVKFDQSVQENFATFYPYTIVQGERADQVSYKFYDDPSYDWIVYLSNNILDPYYDWPLSQENFNQYLITKYGSISKSQSKILFYRNNYLYDDTMLTPLIYENLSGSLKKYYKPVIGVNNTIVSYERKQLDHVVETNKVVLLNVTSTSGFIEGEKVIQGSNSAFITSIGNNTITVDKTTGTLNSLITGQDSNSTTNVTSSNTLSQPITDLENSFWEAVDCYTYENELNESKFNIRILDRSYINKVEKDMRELFK